MSDDEESALLSWKSFRPRRLGEYGYRGTETSFTATLGTDAGNDAYDMNEWVMHLDEDNERAWKLLVEELPEHGGHKFCRHLVKAAAWYLD